MTIDKMQINQLTQKATEGHSIHTSSPTQGFEVGRETGSERTSLVIDKHNLDLLDENTFKIKKALKRRSLSRSVLTRAAITHFNQLTFDEQIALVEKVL